MMSAARPAALMLTLSAAACAEAPTAEPSAAPAPTPAIAPSRSVQSEPAPKAPPPTHSPAAPEPAPAVAEAPPPPWPSAAAQAAGATEASAKATLLRNVHPGCEASAAAVWGDLLVYGDNEHPTALLAGPLAQPGEAQLWPMYRLEGDKPDNWKIKDIEGIAPHPGGVVIVGSLGLRSPKRRCAPDKERQRIGDFGVEGDRLQLTRATRLQDGKERSPRPFLATDAACRAWLGPTLTGEEAAWADALCSALSAAERGAAQAQPEACEATLNVEGAVIDDAGRLWLGLRAPRLPEGAALLRVAEASWGRADKPGELQIDGIALIDLPSSAGVRDLSRDSDRLHLLSGPGPDRGEAIGAWSSAPLAALVPGGRLQPRWLAAVPDHAEGLVLQGREAIVLIDGDKPSADGERDGRRCAAPSSLLRLPHPPGTAP